MASWTRLIVWSELRRELNHWGKDWLAKAGNCRLGWTPSRVREINLPRGLAAPQLEKGAKRLPSWLTLLMWANTLLRRGRRLTRY